MTVAQPIHPIEQNQQELAAAVRGVRAVLESCSRQESAPPASLEAATDPPALRQLCAAFGLSGFERAVLLMCAGMELDGEFAAVCARAQGSPERTFPTFSLALSALPQAHWSALTPAAPLRRWRLVEPRSTPGATLLTTPLEISERVLHFLAGVQYLDERLSPLLEPVAGGALSDAERRIANDISGAFAAANGRLPVVHLCGGNKATRRNIAAAACASLSFGVYALDAEIVPNSASELEAFLRLWERECALAGCGLYVELEGIEGAESKPGAPLRRLVEAAPGVIVLGSHEPTRPTGRTGVWLHVPRPTAMEQRAAWEKVLPAESLNGSLDRLISQFRLPPTAIEACVRQAQASTAAESIEARVWSAARAQARPRLDDLAQRVEAMAEWDDLVLPELLKATLREIGSQVGNRFTVHERWGFAARSNRGLGICALFAGPSGTGKTMAAEVLAGELKLDLYRIDLATVVSKYIGETEKNLRRVFDAAEDGGAILFFDEADALFGKRSEVKDSHDRYANIEISYLLQRMEAYRGLSILATNMRTAMDSAFLRRIRFVANFPHPDPALRTEIWRRVFPAGTPVQGLNFGKLARLNVTGGNIRNIAVNAAFLAADAAEPVGMHHILHAARAEYAKLDKPLTDSEMGDFR